jgi:hypothetical protein
MGPFLKALATHLSPSCNLIELGIIMDPSLIEDEFIRYRTQQDTVQGIENLLDSCTSLQYLWIDVRDARMVKPSSISRHGLTLRQLGLDAELNSEEYYSAFLLHSILKSAPHLEELAVHVPSDELDSPQSLGTRCNHVSSMYGFCYGETDPDSFLVRYCSPNQKTIWR